MKKLVALFVLCSLMYCKPKNESEPPATKEPSEAVQATDPNYFEEQKLREQEAKSQLLKKEGLLESQQDANYQQAVLTSKSFYKEADAYELDYTYPYLIESRNPGFKKFNEYVETTYLNTERTINEILEDDEMLCDSLSKPRFRDKRVIDFKVHTLRDDLISILMYKENYYSGMLHATYMFESLNYDPVRQELIHFDDFFIEGSEDMVFNTINKTIMDGMETGEIYYDCWQMTKDDFRIYKNNFVISKDQISFYLDDCIICPSHTGAYKVVIPVSDLTHLIQSQNKSLLL